jgi:CRISPR-associated Csx2 family protein
MTHTLVTFLGKGRDDPKKGYRPATYDFPDRTRNTNFFGLELADYLKPDRVVILGTSGSMWGVLAEHVVTAGGADGEEAARLKLLDAEAAGAVCQSLLDRVAPVMQRPGQPEIVPQLIPFGRDDQEQLEILATISTLVERGDVSFDVTHAFRHMGMIGMLSAFMLERVGHLKVDSLWYGALDMTGGGITPVLRLNGLHAIQRWVSALDRFDASGDYGVFAPLLAADGVPEDKVRCLEQAAFYERTFNLNDAASRLQTFLAATEDRLQGASELFREKLRERLSWVRGPDLAARQRRLAHQYLKPGGDFVRAAVFAWEALVTDQCRGFDWSRRETREEAAAALNRKYKGGGYDEESADAFLTIRTLRNALAHGNPPEDKDFRDLLASPDDLRRALKNAVGRLLH